MLSRPGGVIVVDSGMRYFAISTLLLLMLLAVAADLVVHIRSHTPQVIELRMVTMIRSVPTNGGRIVGLSCVPGDPPTCYVATQ